MNKRVFVTRAIPDLGIQMLQDKGFQVEVSVKNRPLSKRELTKIVKRSSYGAILPNLTDTVDAEIMDAAPQTKLYANYAVGYNNIDISEAKKRGITITNTPGNLETSVAEFTIGLILASAKRIVEGDNFVRKGKYEGWDPMLLIGSDLKGKTLGIIGSGRIGARVIRHAVGSFEMKAIYYDVIRNQEMEKEYGAIFKLDAESVLRESDFVSIHVPLLPETKHLINAERIKMMKPTACLINTSRGAVIDENALAEALSRRKIQGAALDVYEYEPKIARGLLSLSNVVLTPHIASSTKSARDEMAKIAALNIIDFFEGRVPRNKVW